MPRVTFRFYRELNDFLPPQLRQQPFSRDYLLPGSVKDAIENIGVPHTEVDLVLVNGESVDFAYQLAEGDFISVYPMFEAMDISPLNRLRPAPLRQPRFVLDCHLGKLARYLRMLGFDSLFWTQCDDDTLLQISVQQQRILLTRDLGLLKRRQLERGYFVRATNPRAQLAEVVQRLQLENSFRPFTRCMACNGLVEPIEREKVLDLLPANTRRYFTEFFQCGSCHRVYWKGSHYERMQELVQQLCTGDH